MADSRLKPDPSVNAADLQKCIVIFFDEREHTTQPDLAKYLSHPLCYAVTWKTSPDKDLMAATAQLMPKFADKATNTQMSSTKLKRLFLPRSKSAT